MCDRNGIGLVMQDDSVVVIDPEDYPMVSKYRWHLSSPTIKGMAYARCFIGRFNGKMKLGLMHRMILGTVDQPEVYVDHIDHDTKNNRRSNLRIATKEQSTHNRRVRTHWRGKPLDSAYKGVFLCKTTGRWRARIVIDKKNVSLGVFDTEKLAALAYNEAAIQHHGEFACLNSVEP